MRSNDSGVDTWRRERHRPTDRQREITAHALRFRRIRIAADAQALGHRAGVERAVARQPAILFMQRDRVAEPFGFIQRARQDHRVIDRNPVVGEQPRSRFNHRSEIDRFNAAEPCVTAETGTSRAE